MCKTGGPRCEYKSQSAVAKAIRAQSSSVASELHVQWQQLYRSANGDVPRWKTTTDATWIEAHRTDQVDIASTDFHNLPKDWQQENLKAAEVVTRWLSNNLSLDVSDPDVRDLAGSYIHDHWLKRNKWARGTELDAPFGELSEDEQVKDLKQLDIAHKCRLSLCS